MAHLEHKLSYSRYRENLVRENVVIENGSNHKNNLSDSDYLYLGNEFVAVVNEFSSTIWSKIRDSEPYPIHIFDDELGKQIEKRNEGYPEELHLFRGIQFSSISKVSRPDEYQSLLLAGIVLGDSRIIKSLLCHCPQFSPRDCKTDTSYGHAYIGGLSQVFSSFLPFYLLLNTCMSFSGGFSTALVQLGAILPSKFQSYSTEAFIYGYWEFNSWINVMLQRMLQNSDQIPFPLSSQTDFVVLFSEVLDGSSVRYLSKELFRLMYWAVAVLSVGNSVSEYSTQEGAKLVVYWYFTYQFNKNACRLLELWENS